MNKLARESDVVSVQLSAQKLGADVAGLTELAVYGLKGVCAYADHAATLGVTDPVIYKQVRLFVASFSLTHSHTHSDDSDSRANGVVGTRHAARRADVGQQRAGDRRAQSSRDAGERRAGRTALD